MFAKRMILIYLKEDKLLVSAVKIKEGFSSARSLLTWILAKLPSTSLLVASDSVSSNIPVVHEI